MMRTDDALLDSMLRTLRSTLNACAEPSGHEVLTARIVANFIRAYGPDEIITELGGQGVAAIFDSGVEGPTVLIRAELDGLPVEERRATSSAAHPNTMHPNTMHRCGHDGHMCIVSGLAPMFANEKPTRGRVVLLFQPAEETGEGAIAVIRDPRFARIHPDYALALHNLPGEPAGSVVVRRGTFASASTGIRMRFTGAASHAAEPEHARTPCNALSRLLTELPTMTRMDADPYRMLTVTHARMGRQSFGLTPGRGTVCATLRAASSEALDELVADVEALAHEVGAADGLSVELSLHESFPATRNDDELVDLLEQVCQQQGRPLTLRADPFRWSEDFGHFSKQSRTLYFGLGSGEDVGLHQPGYRFADSIILPGAYVLAGVARALTSDH